VLWSGLDFPGILRRSSSGPAVQEMQARLNALGNHLLVDGLFGPATENAVKVLQASAGLGPDGEIGPPTWRLLWS
jgi:peptidoglycan hydrolase-like protein with peptidoglycan-binding domain